LKKTGRRGSDDAFYKLLRVAGEAVLKLAGISGDFPYDVQAETLKEKKISPDIVAVPLQGTGEIVFMEFQGYADPFIRFRLAGSVVQYCFQKRYTGSILPVIFYTQGAYFKAALPLRLEDGSGRFGLRGDIKEIVLDEMLEDELLTVDPRLVVLAPFCAPIKLGGQELTRKVRHWAKQAREVFTGDKSKEAMDVIALFLLNRFRNLSREEVVDMLNFDLADTRAGQDIFRMGEEKGVLRNARESVIEALEARFEVAPRSVTEVIDKIDNFSILKMLLRKAVTVESLDAFTRILEKALS